MAIGDRFIAWLTFNHLDEPQQPPNPTVQARQYEFANRLFPSFYAWLWHVKYIYPYNFSGWLFRRFAAKKIKKDNPSSVEDVLNYAFSFHYWALNMGPEQRRSELSALLSLLKKRRPKAVLEIGTERGGSFFAFSRMAADDAVLVSIDLDNRRAWKHEFIESLALGSQSAFALGCDSHSAETVKLVENALHGKGLEKFDFIFLDGDHTYKGVKKDFHMYSKMLNKNGIIAFHDITMNHPKANKCEVGKFWNEIKRGYAHKEMVENPDAWFGIGILFGAKR